jgi:sugar O-acyltransferase (sialic acid O-acetyltransferase NeuD family)
MAEPTGDLVKGEGVAQLVIVGAGDHGRVVLELLRSLGEDAMGFVEPRTGGADPDRVVDGLRVLGDLDRALGWRDQATRFVCALGDNRARAAAFERCRALGLEPASAIHPTATLLSRAQVEPGAVVCARATLGLAAWVGANAIINTAASIDHDNRIGSHATIAPGARLAGRVEVGEGALVGIGASIIEGRRVGDWALVAAGAVVIDDVAPHARVAGVPARLISTVAEDG